MSKKALILISKQTLVLCFTLPFLASCGNTPIVPSNETDLSNVSESYSLTYDDKNGELRIEVQFTEGTTGASIELIAPASLASDFGSFNKFSNSSRVYYLLQEPMNFSEEFNLQFSWNSGESLERIFSIQRRFISELPTSVDKGEDLEISWNGNTLADDESVEAIVRDANGLQVSKTSSEVGSSSIVFPESSLDLLSSGLIYVQLIFETESSIPSTLTRGGNQSIRFESEESISNLEDQSLASAS